MANSNDLDKKEGSVKSKRIFHFLSLKWNSLLCTALIALLLVVLNCNSVGENHTLTQGVHGKILLWEGDFMPTTPTGTKIPVQREVYVYELTNDQQTTTVDLCFFSEIRTKFITRITSDASGYYQVQLNPGKYSIFIKENSFFYANSWDGYGNIMPIEVFADSVSLLDIDITYKASF
jgi:hypothetical protein